MDKDAVVGFIKKNALSLACGGVALLAVGAVFYPLGGMVDTLRSAADEKAGMYGTLTSFIKPRKQPMNDLDKPDQLPLVNFPNTPAINAGNTAVAKWKASSDKAITNLIELNRAAHPMLLSDELPAPKYEPNYFNFAKLYRLVLSTDPSVTGNPDSKAPASPDNQLLVSNHDLNLQNDILHGGMPPSLKDIEDARVALWENKYKVQIQTLNGQPTNMTELLADYSKEVTGLPLRLKKAVGRQFKVYVNSDVFTVNPKILPDQKPSPEDIWYSQMQVWIQQDVARAVADANTKAPSVLEAPVKRLLSIQLPNPPMYTQQPAAAGGTAQAVPVPGVSASDSAPIPPNYAVSVSGRYSNPMYDVVQFTLFVDVDAAQVNQFIETLSKGRMMTVLGQNEWALNAETESSMGFLYGRTPVVRLQLTVETLFFRAWTVGVPAIAATPTTPANPGYPALMPDAVKVSLGLLAPVNGMPGSPTPGAPMPGFQFPGGGGVGGVGGPGMSHGQ